MNYLKGDIRRFKANPQAFGMWDGEKWVDYLQINADTPCEPIPEHLLIMKKTSQDEIDFCKLLKKDKT